MERVNRYVSLVYPSSTDSTELGFNLLVFSLFVIGTLHLVFRFPQKQSDAEKAIASLAAFCNETEDRISSRGNLSATEDSQTLNLIRTKYEAIAQSIPANSDKEFLQAKKDLVKKENRKPRMYISPQDIFDTHSHEKIVSSIILGSREIVDILVALRKADEQLYLGGGLVRNAVWDFMHGYTSPTPVDDVDVIYFDSLNDQKQHDLEKERHLAQIIPNIDWSVKNQARMHLVNNENKYGSLEEAIAKWPETATAIAVRLTASGELEYVEPFGFTDLFRLIVTTTPHFASRVEVVRRRLQKKRWLEIWPKLKVWLPQEATDRQP